MPHYSHFQAQDGGLCSAYAHHHCRNKCVIIVTAEKAVCDSGRDVCHFRVFSAFRAFSKIKNFKSNILRGRFDGVSSINEGGNNNIFDAISLTALSRSPEERITNSLLFQLRARQVPTIALAIPLDPSLFSSAGRIHASPRHYYHISPHIDGNSCSDLVPDRSAK